MAILYINTGSSPNAGDGDTLRLAFWKINQNFANIFPANPSLTPGYLFNDGFGNLSWTTTGIAGVVQSPVPPLVTSSSTLWYDTIGGRSYVYYDSTWVDASPAISSYVLPKATTSTLGGVVIGSGITVNNGSISAIPYSLPSASTSTLGGIKLGSGLSISSGTVSTVPYNLPTASASTLGAIRLGSSLSINSSGTVDTVHNIASTSSLGEVIVGDGLSINSAGLLWVSKVLTPATTSTLGGIIVGTGFTIDQHGVLVNNADLIGSLQTVTDRGTSTNHQLHLTNTASSALSVDGGIQVVRTISGSGVNATGNYGVTRGHLQSYYPVLAPSIQQSRGTGMLSQIGASVTTGNVPNRVYTDPSGRFAYIVNSGFSNAGSSITVYTIDQVTGVLTLSSSAVLRTFGSAPTIYEPYDLAMDPAGRFLYVTLTNANALALYSINASSGALSPLIVNPLQLVFKNIIGAGIAPQGIVVGWSDNGSYHSQ